MSMDTRAWGEMRGSNFEFWDEVGHAISLWICRGRAHREGEPGDHITNPAADNISCESCFDDALDLMRGHGVCDLLEIYGSVAYAAGRDGVPEDAAVKRALRAMVERIEEIEAATVLLAELDRAGWWRLPLEHDERPQLPDGDEPEWLAEA